MYRISVFEIRPEPNSTGFLKTYPAGTETGKFDFYRRQRHKSKRMILLHYCINKKTFIHYYNADACTAMYEVQQRLQSTVKLRVRSKNRRYPVSVSNFAGTVSGIG